MTDLMYKYTEFVEAPVHVVFEYCRDPRRIYAGDPTHQVPDAMLMLTPEGVGTTAHVVANQAAFTEDITIEYVEFVPDQRIVFNAYPKMALVGLGKPAFTVHTHVWTWTFAPEDGGTRLNLVVVEEDPALWERALDLVAEGGFSKEVRGRLARIKAGAEEQIRAVG